jgi:hypothetical protein
MTKLGMEAFIAISGRHNNTTLEVVIAAVPEITIYIWRASLYCLTNVTRWRVLA